MVATSDNSLILKYVEMESLVYSDWPIDLVKRGMQHLKEQPGYAPPVQLSVRFSLWTVSQLKSEGCGWDDICEAIQHAQEVRNWVLEPGLASFWQQLGANIDNIWPLKANATSSGEHETDADEMLQEAYTCLLPDVVNDIAASTPQLTDEELIKTVFKALKDTVSANQDLIDILQTRNAGLQNAWEQLGRERFMQQVQEHAPMAQQAKRLSAWATNALAGLPKPYFKAIVNSATDPARLRKLHATYFQYYEHQPDLSEGRVTAVDTMKDAARALQAARNGKKRPAEITTRNGEKTGAGAAQAATTEAQPIQKQTEARVEGASKKPRVQTAGPVQPAAAKAVAKPSAKPLPVSSARANVPVSGVSRLKKGKKIQSGIAASDGPSVKATAAPTRRVTRAQAKAQQLSDESEEEDVIEDSSEEPDEDASDIEHMISQPGVDNESDNEEENVVEEEAYDTAQEELDKSPGDARAARRAAARVAPESPVAGQAAPSRAAASRRTAPQSFKQAGSPAAVAKVSAAKPGGTVLSPQKRLTAASGKLADLAQGPQQLADILRRASEARMTMTPSRLQPTSRPAAGAAPHTAPAGAEQLGQPHRLSAQEVAGRRLELHPAEDVNGEGAPEQPSQAAGTSTAVPAPDLDHVDREPAIENEEGEQAQEQQQQQEQQQPVEHQAPQQLRSPPKEKKRRTFWNEEEVCRLIELYTQYGTAWSYILQADKQHADGPKLQNRSQVDCKDKVRNLMKVGRIVHPDT